MRKLSREQGKKSVELARKTIEELLREDSKEENYDENFLNEKRGVFTTLTKNGELKGCIGFPRPVMELGKAIRESSIKAATDDPRFSPVTEEEFENICVELSILTQPEEIVYENEEELLEKIEIGKDGLIVSSGFRTGLLLPQVAKDNEWGVEEFLSNTCIKAGLDQDAWKDRNPIIKKFQAQIFLEEEPGGKIIEK